MGLPLPLWSLWEGEATIRRIAIPKKLLTFVIDTREQMPYEFTRPRKSGFEDGGTVRYGLGEADYACELDGVLMPVRIERKSMGDYFGIVGHGRERFERELERLRPFKSYLIIEATAQQIRHGYERSLVSGEAAFASAICWSVRFSIVPIFAGDRRTGRDICQRILEEQAEHGILG